MAKKKGPAAVVSTVLAITTPFGSAGAATRGVLTYEIQNGETTITDCDENASGELVISLLSRTVP